MRTLAVAIVVALLAGGGGYLIGKGDNDERALNIRVSRLATELDESRIAADELRRDYRRMQKQVFRLQDRLGAGG